MLGVHDIICVLYIFLACVCIYTCVSVCFPPTFNVIVAFITVVVVVIVYSARRMFNVETHFVNVIY